MNHLTLRRVLALVGAAYCAGALTAYLTWSRIASASDEGPLPEPVSADVEPAPLGTIGELMPRDQRSHPRLLMPVEGVADSQLLRGFTDSGGGREHVAVDILAPRHSPVRAVDAGRIVGLLASERGGLTIYQLDPSEKYCYYYAHLERYAERVNEGSVVRRGQVIGYVGTSGNAPPDAPHLNFAIFALGPEKDWRSGTAVDPFTALR